VGDPSIRHGSIPVGVAGSGDSLLRTAAWAWAWELLSGQTVSGVGFMLFRRIQNIQRGVCRSWAWEHGSIDATVVSVAD